MAAGAGRMGRGIAHMFAYAGIDVTILDLKPRDDAAFEELKAAALAEIQGNLELLAKVDVITTQQIAPVLDHITVAGAAQAQAVLETADFVLEGVPETAQAKRAALAVIGQYTQPQTIVTSTTSTMSVTELQEMISHPSRFMNTHFLNPAFLIPLVEMSASPLTDDSTVADTKTLFEKIGKVPVTCSSAPGYIVPRLQSLVMAEACRMVEQGVATAQDIDKAILNGFGPRYATMGVLEFVDWGGVDILYYAGHYLADALESPAHAPPPSVTRMMEAGHKGLREGRGYYNYEDRDTQAFQEEKLTRFVKLLAGLNQIPEPRP